MAKGKRYGNKSGGSTPKAGGGYIPAKELTDLAYKMGMVKRGLQGDSRIKDSYDAGVNSKRQKEKSKSLFGD